MTKFVGRRGSLGLALELSRGVGLAPTCWMPFVTMSFFDRANQVAEEQGMGDIDDQDSFYVTMRMGEGEVESQLYDKAFGYILTSLLGAAPSTSGSGTYTHAFTKSDTNVAPTLSLYWTDPNQSLMFTNAVVDSLAISIEPSGIVNYTIGFKSKAAKNWAQLSDDFSSLGEKFLHQHAHVRIGADYSTISSASEVELKAFDMTISRNTVFDEVIGTAEPEDVLSQQLSIEGSMNLNLEDETFKNYMLNGTYRAMQFQLYRSASSNLTLRFPRVSFSEYEPDFTLNEIAKQSINFKANSDRANNRSMIAFAELVNAQSSY